MKLVAYRVTNLDLPITPASANRGWMEFFNRFPYRCLPLTIANATGWEVRFNADLELTWNGADDVNAVKILNKSPENNWCSSHFGAGILTMNLPYLFRTPPGVDLWVRGPVNEPRADIAPLEGIVETWWLPFTFTMNWQCLAKDTPIVFKKGDVACRIVPVPHGYLQQFEPEFRNLTDDPELLRQYDVWNRSRTEFNKTFKAEDWQKHYHRGENYTTGEQVAEHVTAVKLADFSAGRAKQTLGNQIAELLREGRSPVEIASLLDLESYRRNRGGSAATPTRLIAAYKELWETDENTRYLVYLPDGKVHPELYSSYEEAVAFVGGRDWQILRTQV